MHFPGIWSRRQLRQPRPRPAEKSHKTGFSVLMSSSVMVLPRNLDFAISAKVGLAAEIYSGSDGA